jgi:hypothetical protein
MNRFRNLTIAATMVAIVAAAAAGAVSPAFARDAVSFSVSVGPPPPRVEYVPAPRAGYVWAPGYWNWNGGRHVWVNGHYLRSHGNQRWVADSWDHRGGRWYHQRGHWSH